MRLPNPRACLALLATVAVPAAAPAAAAEPPAPVRTLRVEYVHTGNAAAEHFALSRVVLEPLPWPGHPAASDDHALDLGKYRFEVVEPASGRVLFGRGFASIFGEWETTGEAAELERAFVESVRFPRPAAAVRVRILKRAPDQTFREIWTVPVDPADLLVDAAAPPAAGPPIAILESGPPADKVDLLLLGDGYTAAERDGCAADAQRLAALVFEVEPFRSRRGDFNVRALCPAAAESGIARPSLGVHRRSPAGATYDAFRSERYVLSFAESAWRDLASQVPYEHVEIFANAATYGGGGIFGLYATVAADSAWAPYIFVHEFGHHFAALADEYYTSDVAYQPATERIEPWEPNVTALADPARLKWADLVTPGTPLPTPWEKAAFEARAAEIQAERRRIRTERRPEAEMDALFGRQREEEERRLGAERYAGRVGAFEGANYEARGYFRPAADCVMFTRDRVPFCPVCRRALERVIDFHAGGGAP